MDPKAPSCYSLLPSLPGTIPVQNESLGWSAVLTPVLGAEPGVPEQQDVHSQQYASCCRAVL